MRSGAHRALAWGRRDFGAGRNGNSQRRVQTPEAGCTRSSVPWCFVWRVAQQAGVPALNTRTCEKCHDGARTCMRHDSGPADSTNSVLVGVCCSHVEQLGDTRGRSGFAFPRRGRNPKACVSRGCLAQCVHACNSYTMLETEDPVHGAHVLLTVEVWFGQKLCFR